jgi:hypothetical protein
MTTINDFTQRFFQASTAEAMEAQLNPFLAANAIDAGGLDLAGAGSGETFLVGASCTKDPPVAPTVSYPQAFCYQGSDAGAVQREMTAAVARARTKYPNAQVGDHKLAGSSDGHSFMGLVTVVVPVIP